MTNYTQATVGQLTQLVDRVSIQMRRPRNASCMSFCARALTRPRNLDVLLFIIVRHQMSPRQTAFCSRHSLPGSSKLFAHARCLADRWSLCRQSLIRFRRSVSENENGFRRHNYLGYVSAPRKPLAAVGEKPVTFLCYRYCGHRK